MAKISKRITLRIYMIGMMRDTYKYCPIMNVNNNKIIIIIIIMIKFEY